MVGRITFLPSPLEFRNRGYRDRNTNHPTARGLSPVSCRFGSQNRVYVVLGRFRCRFECRRLFEPILQELQYFGLVVVFSGDFEQIQARSIKFCVKYSGRHIGISHWAYTDSGEIEKQRLRKNERFASQYGSLLQTEPRSSEQARKD